MGNGRWEVEVRKELEVGRCWKVIGSKESELGRQMVESRRQNGRHHQRGGALVIPDFRVQSSDLGKP